MLLEPNLVEGVGEESNISYPLSSPDPTLGTSILSWGSMKVALGKPRGSPEPDMGLGTPEAQEIAGESVDHRNAKKRVGNPTFVVL